MKDWYDEGFKSGKWDAEHNDEFNSRSSKAYNSFSRPKEFDAEAENLWHKGYSEGYRQAEAKRKEKEEKRRREEEDRQKRIQEMETREKEQEQKNREAAEQNRKIAQEREETKQTQIEEQEQTTNAHHHTINNQNDKNDIFNHYSMNNNSNIDESQTLIESGPGYDTYKFPNKSISSFGRYLRKVREFYWYVAGANIDILRLCPSCYGIYAVIGTLICLTASLALLTGAYAAYSICDSWIGLIFAPIYAYLIFSIDRSFVVGGGNTALKTICRFILAIVIGLIISVPIEILIFRGEIDEHVAKNHKKTINELQDNQLSAERENVNAQIREITTQIEKYKEEEQQAQSKMNLEDNYRGGQGKRWRSDSLQRDAAQRNLDDYKRRTANQLNYLYNQLQRIDTREQQNSATISQIQGNNDLMTRYKAFNTLIEEDIDMKIAAWAIRILFIMFEIAPILSKILLSDNNQYEELNNTVQVDKNNKYKDAIISMHERMFGKTFKEYYERKFEPLSGYMKEEYHKAQLVYKRLDDLNHLSRNNDYK